uniref:Uncharacterized protein n=1 Tax=Acrobeloides nanus TaxID=290746 RepID=A0A914DJA7_9BILA
MIEYDDGEFGGPHEQEEYFIGNRNSESARLAHTSTLHIKRAKRKKRKVWYLVHSKLSPSVYKVFIDVAIGQLDLGKEETNIKKVIRSLMNTGELGVVKNSDHAILGHLDYAIIHLPTHRLVLHSEHRAQILDYCVQRFIHEPDPVGACINFIENNFFGFGDEIRVRDQILKRIKLQPLDQTAKDVNQYYEVDSDHISRLFEEAELNEPQPGPSNEPVTRRHFNAKEPVYYPDKDLTKAAILDDYHDILYELLIGTMGVDEVVDENLRDRLFPELWRWLIPEEIDETGDELVHGFRIRRRSDARIILKTSESELIWHLAREKLSSIHTNDQISFFVHERYVGAAPNREFCDPFSTILLRGQQINFPKPPPTIGSSPMQYVQIDVIEMPACRFNGRDYTNILVRHLVDVFGSFSVPEGFRSGSPQKALSIAINDIRSMFDVNISYLGLGTIVPFMAREEICKRAKQIGRENSWVEVLPSTVIALNQKPHKAFDRKFSAFEVIFKRRPWKNQNLPPWLLSSRDENLPKIESSEQESFEYILNEYLKKKRPILNESGELTDPGTGFLFKPNDYVYIKNPCYQEQVEVVAKEIRADNPRYFRAVVTRVELTNPDFPYRVRYWDNPKLDELPANSWPEPGARETRVHVYDIVASTPRLAYLRNM